MGNEIPGGAFAPPSGSAMCVPCWVVMARPLIGPRIANRVPVAVYTEEEEAHQHARKIDGYAEVVPLKLPNHSLPDTSVGYQSPATENRQPETK